MTVARYALLPPAVARVPLSLSERRRTTAPLPPSLPVRCCSLPAGCARRSPAPHPLDSRLPLRTPLPPRPCCDRPPHPAPLPSYATAPPGSLASRTTPAAARLLRSPPATHLLLP